MISWEDFRKVEMRVGTVTAVEDFPEARVPAYKLTIDFGNCGVKRSSAQITKLYKKQDLQGKQVVAVTNFQPKQIGNFMSEVLVLGVVLEEGGVVLLHPEQQVPNGLRIA